MPLPYDLDGVRKAPSMYLPKAEFDSVAAYVYGLNAATHETLLLGFREWLIPRVGGGTEFVWSALVLRLAFPGVDEPREELHDPGSHARAIECMFSSLEAFWDERARPSGLRSILLRFQAWLERQDWYGPDSWDWIDTTTLLA